MANRRVSELNELLASQVDSSDLFLITDASAFESKRIRASQLRTYTLDGTASYASRAGTASYCNQSGTASFLQYNGWFNGSASYSISASYALSASYANFVKSASYALSASDAFSSSYASRSFWAETASYALTSSVNLVISSALADQANTASFLFYTPGRINGTASYAMLAGNALTSNTASFLNYTPGILNGTASSAISSSHSETSSYAISASFLKFNASIPNGTASMAITSSYATKAAAIDGIVPSGFFSSLITSESSSYFQTMSLVYSGLGGADVIILTTGNVRLPYTGSNSGSISLVAFNQSTLIEYLYDTAYFSYGDNVSTGALDFPFTLQGMATLPTGDYTLYVTASIGGIMLNSSRNIVYKVDSNADSITTN